MKKAIVAGLAIYGGVKLVERVIEKHKDDIVYWARRKLRHGIDRAVDALFNEETISLKRKGKNYSYWHEKENKKPFNHAKEEQKPWRKYKDFDINRHDGFTNSADDIHITVESLDEAMEILNSLENTIERDGFATIIDVRFWVDLPILDYDGYKWKTMAGTLIERDPTSFESWTITLPRMTKIE